MSRHIGYNGKYIRHNLNHNSHTNLLSILRLFIKSRSRNICLIRPTVDEILTKTDVSVGLSPQNAKAKAPVAVADQLGLAFRLPSQPYVDNTSQISNGIDFTSPVHRQNMNFSNCCLLTFTNITIAKSKCHHSQSCIAWLQSLGHLNWSNKCRHFCSKTQKIPVRIKLENYPLLVKNGIQLFGFGFSFRRYKYTGKKDEHNEDSDVEDHTFDDDEYDAPSNYKQIQITVKSLRADSVVSTGLNISRNRSDEAFYGSKLFVNGVKLLKKSKQVGEGDYIDLVTEVKEDIMKVKRVKVVSVDEEKTQKDRKKVIVKVWKTAFEVDKPEKWEAPTDTT
ncbi:hypothetical protein ScPMuIL_012595 [Solemya velum]